MPAPKTAYALVLVGALTLTRPVWAADFTDTQGHWAERYIQELTNRNLLGGFPDGSFRPDQAVTRAQFATVVDKVFRNPSGTGRSFNDVASSYWASPAIQRVSAANLVTGFPDGSFRPDQPVTRAQALTVLAHGADLPQASAQVLNRFRDREAIPPWALSPVAAATAAQVVLNYPNPNLIEPNRPATRAEVAAFLARGLAYQNGGQAQNVADDDEVGYGGRRFDARLSSLQAGTSVVARIGGQETLFIASGERKGLSLVLDRPVRDSAGAVVLPAGTEILGTFVPARGGSRFETTGVRLDGQLYALAARSEILKDTKDPRETSAGAIAGDALLGGAAGAILGGLTGDHVVATEEVLGAAAAGALVGNLTAPNVVVIEPDTPLELVLQSDFRAR
ncbi:S-layer homology domain-containing protein [Anthocerotibacter panamensis]|uniref:S-layer homology domain-containing protein n=1 Tax=Anthocerotibacter panamensis TaxID=2857077 RepID=UPI001C404C7D|nr:S-layer homology domain-containing protein [Anthocerotibacter panamensis]